MGGLIFDFSLLSYVEIAHQRYHACLHDRRLFFFFTKLETVIPGNCHSSRVRFGLDVGRRKCHQGNETNAKTAIVKQQHKGYYTL